ncbi:GntR family transcriptional regulator [Tsukamurella asaccharolytica]|uniref:GntR family transcriptional regulator n=1 Tax=Tsukamurella asaccharolytica TaxID=2592067 RepID=A0A5C5R7F2_9ACTN|nr:GntR family transcriptional regulator [Tsukamurella asaccharolytica]TWS18055.1 GntR family transcriptional regulator [Tsukamurella asaccharolytica]
MTAGITIDPASPVPPFEQIRQQIVALVGVGALSAGERLPTVRQLASDLRLAPGTVSRAYQELEREGWIVTRRGAGTRVADPTPLGSREAGEAAAQHAVDELVRGLVRGGVPAEVITRVLRAAADELDRVV